jgi:hypothetical protein
MALSRLAYRVAEKKLRLEATFSNKSEELVKKTGYVSMSWDSPLPSKTN